MTGAARKLRDDALAIWQAGVAAVDSGRLLREAVRVEGRRLLIGDDSIELDDVDRLAVVGGGKAGAGMAAALETILGPQLLAAKQVTGWVNVPADCVRQLEKIHLHAARPAGSNEPTREGAAGSEEMLARVTVLGPRDICICLISGGASALMPAPVNEITLADKLAVTRQLAAAGANIQELNTVRKQLSRIKGGGLARACGAGRLFTLIISDVLGDPLDVIGSGPTVPDSSTPADALAILARYSARDQGVSAAVFDFLKRAPVVRPAPACAVRNYVIGNNARSVEAAGVAAVELGYSCERSAARQLEGEAEPIGRQLADLALAMRDGHGSTCFIGGGEPVVRLADANIRGMGGRNQQLVLAAVERLWNSPNAGIVILSGGTDGEDGPTDAAGAWMDQELIDAAKRLGLDPADYLNRNDAYHFFDPLGGLIRTGPTHTNVCDLRVVLIGR
jgi:hydroxypyruvate reductase